MGFAVCVSKDMQRTQTRIRSEAEAKTEAKAKADMEAVIRTALRYNPPPEFIETMRLRAEISNERLLELKIQD